MALDASDPRVHSAAERAEAQLDDSVASALGVRGGHHHDGRVVGATTGIGQDLGRDLFRRHLRANTREAASPDAVRVQDDGPCEPQLELELMGGADATAEDATIGRKVPLAPAIKQSTLDVPDTRELQRPSSRVDDEHRRGSATGAPKSSVAAAERVGRIPVRSSKERSDRGQGRGLGVRPVAQTVDDRDPQGIGTLLHQPAVAVRGLAGCRPACAGVPQRGSVHLRATMVVPASLDRNSL